MESTGVVAINQSVDASSFIRASRKVPGEMLEAETNAGGNFSLFTACCPFVWGSLAALVAVVPSAGVRLCRLFCRCWVLSGVVFRARFPPCFVKTGRRPKNRSLAGISLTGGSGTGLRHCMFVGYDYALLGGTCVAWLLRIAYFIGKPHLGEQNVFARCAR